MIKLVISVLKRVFRGRLQTPVPIKALKRISIKKKENVTHKNTCIVKLKFLALTLIHVSLFNMLFEVNPNIRSLVQSSHCLRFGHTQKFCRNDLRCSHWGGDKYLFDFCPTI